MDIRTGIVDISPTYPVELAGYTQCNRVYQKIDSVLEANIILLSDEQTCLVLVGIDALFVGGSLYQLIVNNIEHNAATEKKIQVCMYSTHTHTAPALDETKPLLGEVNGEYFKHCALSISNAINELCAMNDSPQLGTMAAGSTDFNESIYRRKLSFVRMPRSLTYRMQCAMNPNFDVPCVKQLKLGEIRSIGGELQACIWSWPCHPITHSNPFAVSADFPGVVRRTLRTLYGNDQLPVIYLPGTAGDVRPRFIKKKNLRDYLSQPFSNLFSDSDVDLQSAFNTKLINAIKMAVQSVEEVQIDSNLTIDIKKASTQLENIIKDFDRESLQMSLKPEIQSTHSHNETSIAPEHFVENSLTIRRISIGPLKITDVNAELCTPYNDYNENGALSFITGYSEDSYGYLPSDEQVDAGGYEVDGFFKYFSIKGKYLPQINQQFNALFEATAKGD